MNSDDIDKAYVSPYDKFLFEFDATHDKSASQIKEINKHKSIFEKRDNKDYGNDKGEIWEEF
ncbi:MULTISPECIES: CBU_0585 family protein [Legionella]|uniref:Uncharacterized protein n=1 Tax=Legionella steelei TaxID=947033 RepID=A0A0W0ZIZ5_9GAMM|nr:MULTISPECIES: CBU_0585 family protein [Legionella]KTD68758.1 hypothetical protein Lste_1916 [Legionella steelei]MBN9226789.1 hypothetical protein [Legionella steelei]OJW06661.1 MAG: hypothetical protein BGO44_17880 [Legionella sp. 39-23]